MCGISAIMSADTEGAARAVGRMLNVIAYRGPDASGVLSVAGCTLGHARLSIIDLNTGNQPMTSGDGRYSITFNGEIYNFRELRKELELLGRKFRTMSDTEVVLTAYDAWGAACLDRFRGIFAFVIWDSRERRLFAARDLFGEKPLYYAMIQDGRFIAASEIKAIIASRLIKPKLDLTAVDAFLALGYIPPNQTVYSNIFTLPPGHYLSWQSGRMSIVRYWEPRFDTKPISLSDASVRLRELIAQAVARQMVSDVPVGAFLSGGLDSSTIVAFMQKRSTHPIKTFSVGFGHWINELPYARAVAERYGTEHYEVDLGAPAVAELLERMTEVYDEPFADTSNIPTFLISKYAHERVKVVLSGDGGDELFGGYSWYPPLVKSEGLGSSYPRWAALRTLNKLSGGSHAGLRTRSIAAGLAARWPDPWTRCMMSNIHFRDRERQKLWGPHAGEVTPYVPSAICRPHDSITGSNRGFYYDLTSYLPGDILVKVDRAAMANSLETRAPFLDRDVAEFALSLPVALKVRENETKVVLREACVDLWPETLRGRAKQGFGSPIGEWLGLPRVSELSRRVFARGSRLSQLLPGLDARQASGRNYKTWILLTLGLWLERHEGAV